MNGGGDTVVDPRNSALLTRQIPRAERVCFPGLGHLCFWEDPDAFVRAVVEFLSAAEEPA
jgi:pimeloyl-ACP methyl ester carboxylesterase